MANHQSDKKRRRSSSNSRATVAAASSDSNKKKKKSADTEEYNEEESIYEAESVVDARKNKKGRWEYRIRWKGYSALDDTWEPPSHLSDHLLHQGRRLQKQTDKKGSPSTKHKQQQQKERMASSTKSSAKVAHAKVTASDSMGPIEQRQPKLKTLSMSLSSKMTPVKVNRKLFDPTEEIIDFDDLSRLDENSNKKQKAQLSPKKSTVGMMPVKINRKASDQTEEPLDLDVFPEKSATEKEISTELSASDTMELQHQQDEREEEGTNEITPDTYDKNEPSNHANEQSPSGNDHDDNDSETKLPSKQRLYIDHDSKIYRKNVRSTSSAEDSSVIGRDNEATDLASSYQRMAVTGDHWQWTDEEQIEFRSIESIHVNAPDARRRVTDARLNGVPVKLIGHVGWPHFAHRWLKLEDNEISTRCLAGADVASMDDVSSRSDTATTDWLDLSKNYELDVNKMVADIGKEDVPVLKKGYSEISPVEKRMPLHSFLKQCWPGNTTDKVKNLRGLYLHQWQFPLDAKEATDKLCGRGNVKPLPNDIMGEDLLQYWRDEYECNGDNPFQYLFMGNTGTMSKLHRDPGGLAISIAPIVGQKEVILVHRADLSCLYHLQADLETINLHEYPMLSHARIYKSVIQPGEILLMPQGTFHQCRNVTPCLSYSRFHLDTVNLRGFLESLINQDAPEMEHEDVIWNAASELQVKVDAYTDQLKKNQGEPDLGVSPQIISTIDALRSLRHICREIGKRYENGMLDVNRLPPGLDTDEDPSEGIDFRRCISSAANNQVEATRWNQMIRDIDSTLHDFQYRHNKKNKPPFQSRAPKHVKILPQESDSKNLTPLELALTKLPVLDQSVSPLPERLILNIGTEVEVNWQGRIARGIIKEIREATLAPYVDYEDLPLVFSEYVPLSFLRVPVGGEMNTAEATSEDVVVGRVLVHRHGREEYRCTVRSTPQDTFACVVLHLGTVKVDRWLPRSAILACMKESSDSETAAK